MTRSMALADEAFKTAEYWNLYLENCSSESFPCLTGIRPEKRQTGRSSSSIQIPVFCASLSAKVEKVGFNLKDVVHAAWASILLAYADTNTADVVFGWADSDDLAILHGSESKTRLMPTPVRVRSSNKGYTNARLLGKLQEHRNKGSYYPYGQYLKQQDSKSSFAPHQMNTLVILESEEGANNCKSKSSSILGLKQDVVVHMRMSDSNALTYTTHYSEEKLDEKTAQIMLRQLHEILIWILENPRAYYRNAPGTVSMSLVAISNPDPISYPQEELLQHRFEHYVRTTPECIALTFVEKDDNVFRARNWTYRELDNAAAQVAFDLEARLSTKKMKIVPILMEKSLELYVTILAILKAGATWCPIDAQSPKSRQHDLIRRTGSSIMAINQDFNDYLAPQGVAVVNISSLLSKPSDFSTLLSDSSNEPPNRPTSDSPAYLIYTSGTTGPPKGVLVSHSAAVASMNSLCQTIPGPSKQECLKCIQFSQQTFDVFVQDLFYTWGLGGSLISSSRENMSTHFADIVKYTKATHAHLTPAFGSTLSRKSCPSLEVVTMIGERLSQVVADDWGADINAFNTYGPAEAAVVSTIKEFGGTDELFSSSNIGLPLPTMSTYVLRDDQVVLRNGIGELALAGPQLAEGYLDDATKTSERFIWHETLNKRIYMTGDIVRCLSDGTLDFIGREDDLVKLQGIRVELSEISFALTNCHEAVQQIETMHLARSDRPSKVLVTFLAAEVNEESALHGLYLGQTASKIASAAISQAKSKLPSYMQPGVTLIINSIPHTPSAKIDRKALQTLYDTIDLTAWESAINEQLDTKSKIQHEWTLLEKPVIEAVAAISGIDYAAIRPSSVLLALGIESIVAASLSSALQGRNVKVSVTTILSSRTILDLLHSISNLDSQQIPENNTEYFHLFDQYWRSVMKSQVDHDSHILPTTPFQDSVLAESLLDASAYWSSYAYKLPQNTNLYCLKEAWTALASITEVLRVSFAPTAKLHSYSVPDRLKATFLQLVHSKSKIPWTIDDLESQDAGSAARDISFELAQECANNSFQTRPWAVHILKNVQGGCSIMLLIIHHSLHDASSIEAIFQDLWGMYSDPSPCFQSRTQLSTAVRSIHQPEMKSSTLSFWQDALQDYQDPNGSTFPDLTGSNKSLVGRGLVHFRSDASFNNISNLTSELEISIATVFRAAWGYVLLQYLELPKMVVGNTLSERSFHPELGDAIAPLLSVIPLPISAARTGRELLKSIEEFVKDSRLHRGIAPTTIRKLIDRPHSCPLYLAIFAFHNEIAPTIDTQWEKVEGMTDLNVEHTLALNVSRHNATQYTLEVFADKTRVTCEHVELIALQIEATVGALIKDLDTPLSVLLSDGSSRILARSKSRLPASVPDEARSCATYWLTYHAEAHPTWNALDLAEEIIPNRTKINQFTYAELEARSNQWARCFLSNKLYQSIIGVCLPRGLDLYAVTIGILKSGNTYLPIDETLPTKRKWLLLEDSQSQAIVLDESIKATIGDLPININTIDVTDPQLQIQLSDQSSDHVQLAQETDNAYILYTSGSTGRPKGVLVPHRGLCGFVEGLTAYISSYSQTPLNRQGTGKWLGLSSRAFDVHLCEMFLGWRLGLSFATAPREIILDDLKAALLELKITHAAFVPSLLDQACIEPRDVPDLVYFSVGGEKVSQRILQSWSGQSQTLVVNAYGPTEVSIGCCAAKIGLHSTARNIGRPFGNSTAHVLAPDSMDYTFIGQSGELCMTGDLVGTGYLDRPDARGFVDDFHGERMFRTGDVVRMLADGSLEYLGRSDDQAKIRGQRIELGEVTHFLSEASSEDLDIVTLLLQHPGLPGTQLVSFIAHSVERSKRYDAKPQVSLGNLDQVIDLLYKESKKNLPMFMIPNYILPVSVLPLARISGKADAKVLRAYFCELSVQQLLSSRRTPSSTRKLNEDEQKVADAISSTLSSNALHISPASNVFELGLDSLAAIDLATRLKDCGLTCSLADIFAHQTVQELAMLPKLQQFDISAPGQISTRILSQFEAYHQSSLSSELLTIEHIRPCLPLQEGLIARSLGQESGQLYIHHLTIRLPGDLDLDLLKSSWISVIKRTPILRTSFRSIASNIIQIIHKPDQYFHWQSTTSALKNVNSAIKDIQKNAARSILECILAEPPLRVHQVVSDEKHVHLCITLHHALYDAVSLNLVLNDVYRSYHLQNPIARTPFDNLLSFYLRQSEEEQRSFWTTYLAELIPTTFKTVRLNSPTTIERLASVPLAQLKLKASQAKVTLTTLCQTLFATVLAKFTAADDVSFGVILSGRAVPVDRAESLLGPCITTIPQRVTFDNEDHHLAKVAQKVQQSIAKCLQHQHTPLRKIHRWLGKERIFDSLFQYLSEFKEPASYSKDWSITESQMPNEYPLNVQFRPNVLEDVLQITISYNSSFGAKEEATRFCKQLDALFENLEQIDPLDWIHADTRYREADFVQQESPESQRVVLSSTEESIRQVIAEYTGLESTNILTSTSFFRLGIDSVAVLELARRLQTAGIHVRGSSLMQHSSIGQLSEHLRGAINPNSAASTSQEESQAKDLMASRISQRFDFDCGLIEAIYPCTPLQSGMLTATLASDGTMYVHHHVLRLAPNINLQRLLDAWTMVQEDRDILRTSFWYDSESLKPWNAVVHTSWKSNVQILKTSTLLEGLRHLSQQMTFKSPEDFHSPPICIHTFKDAEASFIVLSIHHAIYDGLSMQMIRDDLAHHYQDNAPVKRIQFYEAAKLITAAQEEHVSFWTHNLRGYIPSPMNFSVVSESRPIFIQHKLSVEVGQIVHGCRSIGVTVQSAALLAYAKVLTSLYKQRDIVFGHVVSGRSIALPLAENIIGPLFNTVPFRIQFELDNQSNGNLVNSIQEFTGRAQDHQQAPLQDVLSSWRKSYRGSNKPINALFLFQRNVEDEKTSTILQTQETDDSLNRPEYPLNLELEQHPTYFTVVASSYEQYLSQTQLQNITQLFEACLEDIIQTPKAASVELPPDLQALPLHQMENESPKPKPIRTMVASEKLDILKNIISKLTQISVDDLKPDSSIYTLGLDSILAIKVASLCRKKGLKLSVADVIQGETLEGICHRTEKTQKSDQPQLKDITASTPSYADLPIETDRIETVLPCLSGQAHQLDHLMSSPSTELPVFAFVTVSTIKLPLLQRAWGELRRSNPILRTCFSYGQQHKPIQVVLRAEKNDQQVQYIENHSGAEESLYKTIYKLAQESFPVHQPPIRLTVLRQSEQDVLLLSIHHALYDAYCVQMLLEDLGSLYNGHRVIDRPSFEEFTKYHLSSAAHPDLNYWQECLKSIPSSIINGSSTSSDGISAYVALPNTINIFKIDLIARKLGISAQAILISAFASHIANSTGRNDVVFGHYVSGRSSYPNGEDVFGPCLNILPFVVRHALSTDIRARLYGIHNDLAEQTTYEQSNLADVLNIWQQSKSTDLVQGADLDLPLFNTYLNIISKTDKHRSDKIDTTETSFLRPLDIDLERYEVFKTAHKQHQAASIQKSKLGLPIAALYIDIVLYNNSQRVDINAKSEGGLMDTESLRSWLNELVQEIKRVVSQIDE